MEHYICRVTTAKENKVDYVYIDTAGTGDNLVNESVNQSDYCLIPCGAGGFDILPLQQTVELINKLNKKASFIITKAPSNSNEANDTDKLLRGFGLNVCSQRLTNLKLYRDAAVLGKSVSECDINSKPSREIKKLFEWLKERVKTNSLQNKLQGVSNV